jgi:D-beta-D-heptose 7-phosphate kinase / D-beta-D-heptose 1-phosphate adenosyltransferase
MTTGLPDFSNLKIIVIGDVMLDVYYWGKVRRISPEAPVPVVHITDKTRTLGGAGNVALNLQGLGCRTVLMGTRGADVTGEQLDQEVRRRGIEARLIVHPGQPTTTKTRVIGQNQQLIRIDEEETNALPADLHARLLTWFDETLAGTGAVILSDYGKGLFKEHLAADVIARCRRQGIPCFVDPKGVNWERYQNAFCITPNLDEFREVTNLDDLVENRLAAKAKELIRARAIDYLLVTRGAQGLSLYHDREPAVHIPTEAQEVFDVSGAGDTVIATLAAAAGRGLDLKAAAALANLAAGVVVGKLGTYPITRQDLHTALKGKEGLGSPKICTRDQARTRIAAWHNEEKRIVFTNGCFDLLHVGHIKLLHLAAQNGDRLVVGLNSDASVKRLKGDTRPIVPEAERAALLASIAAVDLVIIFEEDTPIELITAIKPDILVKGGDYTVETVVGHDVVGKWGGRVVLVPLEAGHSTTGMIAAMRNRMGPSH